MTAFAWEPVWSGEGEAEAEIVAGRLRADRVRTRVVPGPGRLPSSYGSTVSNQTWIVVAHASQARAARAILERRDRRGVVHPEDFANPVAANWRQMKSAAPWILAAVLVAVTIALLRQL